MENQNKIQKDQALGQSTPSTQRVLSLIMSEQPMKTSFLKIRREL